MVLLESVPNVSEGRDAGLVAAIGEAFCSAGATLVDVHRDPWHHRSVFTLVGEGAALVDGLVAGIALARARIDLAGHDGVHPRVGVVDVVPLVALAPEDEAAADVAALLVAERVGAELGLPVFLYGASAEGRRPTFYRAGGVDELHRRVDAGELRPTFGPDTARCAERRGARGVAHAARRLQRGARRTARGRAGGRGRGAGLVRRAARRAGARSAAGRRHASRSRRTSSTSMRPLRTRSSSASSRRPAGAASRWVRGSSSASSRRRASRRLRRRRASSCRSSTGCRRTRRSRRRRAPCGFRASSRTASSSGTSRRLASG